MTPAEQRRVDLLERAFAVSGTHDIAWLVRQARAGFAQVWEQDDALIATEIVDHPCMRTLRYLAVAGSLHDVRELQLRVDDYGRQEGATRAEAFARRGWERVPDTMGWRRLGGFWMKDLAP